MKKIIFLALACVLAVVSQSCGSSVGNDPKANARLFVNSMVEYANTGDSTAIVKLLGELCDKYENAPLEEVMAFGIASQQDLSALSPEEIQKISEKLPELNKIENYKRFQNLAPKARSKAEGTDDMADYSDVADM